MHHIAIILSYENASKVQANQDLVLIQTYVDKFNFSATFFSPNASSTQALLTIEETVLDLEKHKNNAVDALLFLGNSSSCNNELQAIISDATLNNTVMGFIGHSVFHAGSSLKDVKLTAGLNPDHINSMEAFGSTSIQANTDDVAVDKANSLYSTPGRLQSTRLSELAMGYEKILRFMKEALPELEAY